MKPLFCKFDVADILDCGIWTLALNVVFNDLWFSTTSPLGLVRYKCQTVSMFDV